MKPNILVVNPLHLDYPRWRYDMVRFKDYFNSIWVVFSQHHQEIDYSNFIRAQLPFANFVEATGNADDWRNGCINQALDVMPKDGHVLFVEQDFLIHDDTFLKKVFTYNYDFLYYKEGERFHPAFACVKREIIERTSRDFSAKPQGDHFKQFFDEVLEIAPYSANIADLDVKFEHDYYHMAGFSQNFMSIKYGDPLFKLNNFLYFNWKSLSLPVEQHPQFFQIMKAIEREHGHPKNHSFLNNFFPS